jgi:hypothetical protein
MAGRPHRAYISSPPRMGKGKRNEEGCEAWGVSGRGNVGVGLGEGVRNDIPPEFPRACVCVVVDGLVWGCVGDDGELGIWLCGGVGWRCERSRGERGGGGSG